MSPEDHVRFLRSDQQGQCPHGLWRRANCDPCFADEIRKAQGEALREAAEAIRNLERDVPAELILTREWRVAGTWNAAIVRAARLVEEAAK